MRPSCADHEGRRDRQHPAFVALILRQRMRRVRSCIPPFRCRPRSRGSATSRSRCPCRTGSESRTLESAFISRGELLAVRHDRDHAARRAPRCAAVRLRQRVDADAALGTPVAAMEGHDGRTALAASCFRLTSRPFSSGSTKGGITSPGLGAVSPALCSFSRLTSRSTIALVDGCQPPHRVGKTSSRSLIEPSRSRACSKAWLQVGGERSSWSGVHVAAAETASDCGLFIGWNCADFPAISALSTIAALYDLAPSGTRTK